MADKSKESVDTVANNVVEKADEVVENEVVEKTVDEVVEKTADTVVYVPLQQFADNYATTYGIELMAAFYHSQERSEKYADTEENFHNAIKAFAKKEVK